MVSSMPNWAQLQAKIVDLRPHPEKDDLLVADLDVHDVQSVGEFKNMFQSAAGQTIPVNVSRSSVESAGIKPGALVNWRVRKGGPENNFADSDSIA